MFLGRVGADLRTAEEFVEPVGKQHVVVGTQHRDDERLAEPPRPQEHHVGCRLQVADLRGAVYEPSVLLAEHGVVRHAVEYGPSLLHAAKYTTILRIRAEVELPH